MSLSVSLLMVSYVKDYCSLFAMIMKTFRTYSIEHSKHDTLSKQCTVIFEDKDATGLDNQVIDRSG